LTPDKTKPLSNRHRNKMIGVAMRKEKKKQAVLRISKRPKKH
jgi:hypothetical protein